MTFGQEFREARIKADLGLKQVAERMGRSVMTVLRIEADNPRLNDRTKVRAQAMLDEMKARAQESKSVVNQG